MRKMDGREVRRVGSDEVEGFTRIEHTQGARGERVSGLAEIERGDGWRWKKREQVEVGALK